MSHRCSSSSRPNVFINARRWNQLYMQILENRKPLENRSLNAESAEMHHSFSLGPLFCCSKARARTWSFTHLFIDRPFDFRESTPKEKQTFFPSPKSLTYTFYEEIPCWSSSLILIAWRKRLSFHEAQLNPNRLEETISNMMRNQNVSTRRHIDFGQIHWFRGPLEASERSNSLIKTTHTACGWACLRQEQMQCISLSAQWARVGFWCFK